MRLHRPSLLVGIGAAGVAVVTLVAISSAASAISWPWSSKPRPEIQVTVSGAVSCSDVASLNGLGGNPEKLALSDGHTSKTISYPFTLRGPSGGAIYRPPTFQAYAMKVTIPANADKATVNWELDCRDQTGKHASTTSKSFDVGRADDSRTICSYGGLFPFNPCVDPKYDDALGECAAAIFTAGVSEPVLDLTMAVLDNGGWQSAVKAAIATVNPVVGIALGCTGVAKGVHQEVPVVAAPTVVPTLNQQTSQPMPTVAQVPVPQPTSAVPPPAPPSHPVNAYDNYGPANAGRAMCRGNPGNSLSMPGGTASQTFAVPSGVSTLTHVLVQIDPDPTVTAHLRLYINGGLVAAVDATASGDTNFGFGPVPVSAGQSASLSISFTATYGKIITVYTAGSPGGSFTASNSCPDGAPNVSTSATGLRAQVTGMS